MAEETDTISHEPRADREERAAKLRRGVALVGNLIGALALLAAVASVAAILWFTSHDVSIGSVIDDDPAGTMTIAFPFLMVALSMIGFFFGQFGARGRWGTSEKTSVLQSGSFRVELRPISVGLHGLFLGLAVLAWALFVLVPVALEAAGTLSPAPGGSAAEQFWFTVVVYAVVTGAIAAVVAVSLLKKVTYNRSLERGRSTIVDGSPSQVAWRRFSHVWRGELMIAAAAGAAIGLSPIGFHLDSLAFGLAFAVAGAALLAASIALALNSWRSGLPVERVESYT
ncbi:hypothetical protein [Mycetocola miduiensis]|uniref:Uncharacterized protein n=1 Tax=Mycetocola miduiensis TaxID=995034 RepID=A0A1I5D2F0_9MICO|nr:hypothetical protein [Mycetocola miduiensis]SFN93327.1 hypothetical protein SAMN05216219_2668 [Mycetocola miduiensis]